LAALGVEPSREKPMVPTAGVELREYILALTSAAASLDKPASVRLAAARALDVDAGATELEVREYEIGALAKLLPMPFHAKGGERARDELISRGLRRTIEPAAFRIGDEIHVVAPPAAIPDVVRAHPRARVHPVEELVPPIVRLREAINEMTIDDLIVDPILERLIGRLDPTGREAVAFAHARAVLFRAKAVEPRRPTPANWRGAVAAMVAGDPPPALLCVEAAEGHAITTDSLRPRATDDDLRDLPFFPAACPLLILAGASVLVTDKPAVWGQTGSIETPRWQDELEAWLQLRERKQTDPWGRVEKWAPPPANVLVAAFSQDLLDGMLASTWFALRRALASSEVVARSDGRAQVHVGSGICLVLDARVHPREDGGQLRAALVGVADRGVWLTRQTTLSGRESSYEPGWTTPRGLYLSGSGYSIDVRFVFAPWLSGAERALAHHVPVLNRLADDESAEAARQAQEAYDDDD
jgi:hypothetical protein